MIANNVNEVELDLAHGALRSEQQAVIAVVFVSGGESFRARGAHGGRSVPLKVG